MRINASRLEDRLDPLEPSYRSRGEAQVGRLLDRYGIPFFYEQPILMLDHGRHRIWHPDFALPTFHGLLVEYAGMPHIPKYAAGIRHKQAVYKANEVPVLFLYPCDLQGPSWPEKIMKKIDASGRTACQRAAV